LHTNHVQDSKARTEKVGSPSMYAGGNPVGAAATLPFEHELNELKELNKRNYENFRRNQKRHGVSG
jgi:hypothetical protein